MFCTCKSLIIAIIWLKYCLIKTIKCKGFFFFSRCADLIQARLHSIEDSLSTRTGTEEKIEEALNWIENIESDLKKLPKVSGFDETDGEKILEKCEVSFILIVN